MASVLVKNWLGEKRFALLHPLLQALHTQGGVLHGKVQIDCHGAIGQMLARKMGVPVDQAQQNFTVFVSHERGALQWHRQFGNGAIMHTQFKPIGTQADGGYWLEDTGALHMRLGVDIVDGGWHWRCLQMRLGGVPLPAGIFPQSHAYKTIEDGQYRFDVRFTVPLLGTVLRYGGLLQARLNGGLTQLDAD